MKKKGFTILEVMLSVTILTVAVGGSYALIQQTLVAASISQSRLVAAYLAQEGVEIVRNIRDANWLRLRTDPLALWDDGLTNCDAPFNCCEGDYNDDELESLTACDFEDLDVLNIEDSDVYGYGSGEPTLYRRKITIDELSENSLEVSVEVYWENRGNIYSMDPVVEHLYNWY